jgi:hypothetical protein
MQSNQTEFYFATADEAESAFYSAFEMGDVQLMDAVLALEGVSCIHPGTTVILGRDAVLDSWAKILQNINEPAFYTEVLNRSLVDNIAVHLVAERIAVDHQPDAVTSLVLATNVYILQQNGWRLMMHHASVPSIQHSTSKNSGPAATHAGPETLH